jgi:transposase
MDENKYSERRDYRHYPESLKLAIVREYESTKASKAYLKRKYGISTTNTIKYWLSKYGNNAYLSIPKNTTVMSSKTEDSYEVQKLKQRIHQLERELEDAKLLSEAYSLMIKKAEEELKIPIRKKYNTK